jgi:hypothetical protein
MLGLLGMCLPARGTTLTYVGVQTIPTGAVVGGVEIGGLSGISYNPYTDRFVAITDDSSTDGASRMWTLDLAYTGAAFSSVTAVSSIGLKKPDGSTLPLSDTEGIAGNLDGSFYVSHEGLAAGVDATYSIPPWIARFNGATGNKEADVALPVKFLPRNSSGNQVPPDDGTQTSGVRSNLSLECLGITPSKKVLFTSNEAALKQDYNGTYDGGTNQAQNSLTRIVRFTGAPGNPVAAEEKVYQADQGTLYIIVRRFNTVPEILPVDDSGRMLVMERGLTQNNTNTGSYRIRIYEVNFNQTGTTNVASVNSLIGASYTTLSKTLRWQSSSNMDNVESMCFGRDVNGFRTLVLASDNNFNGAQTTQFHVLMTDIPAVTRRTLATAVTGSGNVAAAPSVAWYPDGSEVSLTATPATSHTFANWNGSMAGSSNPVGLTMDADKSVTANFQKIPVTNVAYWRGGENDFPQATQGSRFTTDIAGSYNLQPRNSPQSTLGYNEFGPYYAYAADYSAGVNATRAPGSTVNFSFDPGAGNAFVGEAITTTTTNWGIQCYTNSTQNGQIISNGNVAGIGSGGYGFLVYNNHYSGIMNGVALLEGTIAPDGNWHNLALVNDNGTLKLYVDGVLNASSNPGASLAFAAGNKLTIGAGYNGSNLDGFTNGGIDEVRIFTFGNGQFLPSDLQNYIPQLTYASWSTTFVGGQAANLDYDSDGVANGIEYFMNAAPGFTANPAFVGNTVTWPNGGNIPSSAYGTQFVVQTSNNLASWTDVPITDANLTNTPGLVSYTLTGGPDRQFVRLKATPD